MKIGNLFVKLISSLFVLLFGLLCLTTTVFLLARSMTSQDNIKHYLKNANVFDYPINDVLSDNQGETLRQTLKKDMLDIDMPALVVDDVIDSNALYEIINSYIYEYSRYILYNDSKPVLLSDKILNIVEEKYNKRENKSLSAKQKSEVSDYITQLIDRIDEDTFDKSEIDEMISINIIRKVANIFDSKYMVLTLTLIIVIIFAIISICLSSVRKAINWCSKITIFDGILLIVASFVEVRVLIMYFNSQGLLDNLAISVIENGFKNMLTYGLLLIAVGITFVIISAILLKKEKKESTKITSKKIDLSEKLVNKEEVVKDENEKQEPEPQITEVEDIDKGHQETQADIKQNEKSQEEKSEEVTIVAVPEETTEKQYEKEPEEIDYEEETDEDVNSVEEYTEIHDEKEEIEPIVKRDIKFTPLETIKVDVTYPEKGKNIEFNPEDNKDEDEEDIEIL